jgi:hypothetical protein
LLHLLIPVGINPVETNEVKGLFASMGFNPTGIIDV